MISFENDYNTGAHPQILARLAETNLEPLTGYGADHYCESAKNKIREACGCPDAEVEFLVGGTQTNAAVISTMLKDYEGVIAADTGHVNVHEAGAIEYTGHKVLALPQKERKLSAADLSSYIAGFYADETYEHMVFPGMVYISHPTEYGTLYTKAELEALAEVCRSRSIPLFLDGARLGYGLMSRHTDVTLQDIARLCDVFYIGGTKVGALFGEAVVISNPVLKKDFRYLIKQHGGMLAKGRLLGIQFDTLFAGGLYFEISKHADRLAIRLREAFVKKGYGLRFDSYTNQQFPILPNSHIERLRKKYSFAFWEAVDDTHSAVRFCTSWATREESVDELIRDIEEL